MGFLGIMYYKNVEKIGKYITLVHCIDILVSTIILLLTYRLLFQLKRVEIQLNKKYSTA